jgi:aspartate/methionine/tyrosine aminotransferase
MFSGLRLGYVVAPSVVLECLNRIMVHQLYSPSTLGQQMMVAAVTRRSTWKPAFVDHIQGVRDRVLDGLAVSPQKPEGAYYLFFSITPFLQGRKYWDVINACFDSGVSVAPGEDFGSDYHDYVRICFAGEPPDRLALAIERLNTIFPG